MLRVILDRAAGLFIESMVAKGGLKHVQRGNVQPAVMDSDHPIVVGVVT